MVASVAVFGALAYAASQLPSINPPVPIYAIVHSDSLFPLTIPSSWGEFSQKYDTQVSDYPFESGAYAIYNKVRRPVQVSVTLIKTGSDVARFAWLAMIQQQEANDPTALYTLVSPQEIFVDFTIAGMNYETRQDKGSNILHLTITFSQIQQIPASAGTYTDTAEAKSGPVQQLGTLYSHVVSASESVLVNAGKFILS